MKILYKNLLDYGTVTATNENPNYPVSNLTYTLLRSRTLLALFKATGNSSTITCVLDDTQTVDAIGVGNHNLSQIVVTLKNSGGGTIGTETLTTAGGDLSTSYSTTKLTELSTSYSSVKTIELALTTTSTYAEIGGLYVGEVLNMDNATFAPSIGSTITSTADITDRGVVSGKPGVILASQSWPMSGITKAKLDDCIDMFEYCQTNRPMFINVYPDDDSRQWFGRITNNSISATVIEGGAYDLQIDFEEVR